MSFYKSLKFAVSVAALCASVSIASAQVVYNRGNDADPETLDPHKASTVGEANIFRDLLEGLTIHNGEGKVVPGAAEKWTISPDAKVYTFTIRANAKWSNGDPVTASDFVYSMQRILNPETGAKYASVLFPIKNAEAANGKKDGKTVADIGVKAIDDKTLEITLERPTPYILELLTHNTGLPVHKASVEKFGKDFVKPENMVTNGAFTLAENVPNSHIRLKKNPNFHDAANVNVDVVNVIPSPDLAAAARRFMAGELDVTTDIPADQIKFLREKLGDQVKVTPYLGTNFLLFQTQKPPMTEAKVRRALSMAIDREFLADQVWQGTMLPAYSIVPPGIGNYVKTPVEYDFKALSLIDREEQAKKLLAEAGYGAGKKLQIEYRYNTTDNNKAQAVAIADMWKQIGVETTFINTDGKTHFAFLRDNRDFQVARYGWIGDYSDPQNFLFLLESKNKGLNAANFSNADFDKLMVDAENEVDLGKRADILAKAERIGLDGNGWVPVLFYSNKNLISSKVKGFTPNLRGANASRYISITR